MSISNSITCFKDDQIGYPDLQFMDPQAVNGLMSLCRLKEESKFLTLSETQRNYELTLQILEEAKKQIALVAEENLRLRKRVSELESNQRIAQTIHQGEIEAWKTKYEQTNLSLQNTRTEVANLRRQAEVDRQKAVQDLKEAVAIAVQTYEGRVQAIKQQIMNIDKFYIPPDPTYGDKIGHWLGLPELESLQRGNNPDCSCHQHRDPNSYESAVYERWKLSYLGPENWYKLHYDGEFVLRKNISRAFVEYITAMRTIGS